MPRAVLDSSVLVSAFLTPAGTPAALLARARAGAFVVCLSQEILTETTGVLLRPHLRARAGYTPEEVAQYAATLTEISVPVSNLPTIKVVEADPDDDAIVATALAGRADYLVTGDRHLLALDPYDGIRILTPRAFLEAL